MKFRHGSSALGTIMFWTFFEWHCIYVSIDNACGPTIILRDPTFSLLLSRVRALARSRIEKYSKILRNPLLEFCLWLSLTTMRILRKSFSEFWLSRFMTNL